MTVTALDPGVALVLVDLQRGVVAYPQAHPTDAVCAAAGRLAKAFRASGRPVVLVNVDYAPDFADAVAHRSDVDLGGAAPPADWAELVDALDARPSDLRVTKRNFGAFHGTELDLQLRRRGVTQIVFGGIATSIGVESTARAAHDIGYQLTFAVDAMTDPSQVAHDHCVAVTFPILGEVGTADDVIAALS